jgi:cell wall-associated NlpC family hydrolase
MTTDARMLPANGFAAAIELKGEIEAARYVKGVVKSVQQPLVNMTDEPRGKRTSQLLFGERFRVIDERDGYAFGQAERDGYCGYVVAGALGGEDRPTHWVAAPATHLYPKPELKAPPEVAIFFGSQVHVVSDHGDFFKISTGHFIPRAHLQPLKARFSDPVGVADLFLGTPYLWGGCSRWGIDCSGLVQMALLACGIDCPRDSDQQHTLGRDLHHGEPYLRGDLVFWKGHVGIMASEDMMIHANAFHMATAYEPIAEARKRIRGGDVGKAGGEITAKKRLRLPDI